jgi:hypothetical protein
VLGGRRGLHGLRSEERELALRALWHNSKSQYHLKIDAERKIVDQVFLHTGNLTRHKAQSRDRLTLRLKVYAGGLNQVLGCVGHSQ